MILNILREIKVLFWPLKLTHFTCFQLIFIANIKFLLFYYDFVIRGFIYIWAIKIISNFLFKYSFSINRNDKKTGPLSLDESFTCLSVTHNYT